MYFGCKLFISVSFYWQIIPQVTFFYRFALVKPCTFERCFIIVIYPTRNTSKTHDASLTASKIHQQINHRWVMTIFHWHQCQITTAQLVCMHRISFNVTTTHGPPECRLMTISSQTATSVDDHTQRLYTMHSYIIASKLVHRTRRSELNEVKDHRTTVRVVNVRH